LADAQSGHGGFFPATGKYPSLAPEGTG
jgi:hypothetical protein